MREGSHDNVVQLPVPASDSGALAVPAGATLRAWGNQPWPGVERRGEDLEKLTRGSVLSRGLGRSYGDSSFPPADHPVVTCTVLANRILGFDPQTGVLRAEAGLSLRDLVYTMLPQGWFTPVTPGTWYVTLGGMVASDVHGKNHHSDGCFGEHVVWLRLRLGDGRILECSATENADLFLATIGGMGLTGHILEVAVRMRRIASPWILQEKIACKNLDDYMEKLHGAAADWPMTVGWIDCFAGGDRFGRGLLTCGRWATPDEAPAALPRPKRRITIPDLVPNWLLNPLTGRIGWTVLSTFMARSGRGIVHPEVFFTPLDMFLEWNRLYGRSGLTQYQCVLPHSAGADAPRRVLDLFKRSGAAIYLCVVKDCGPQGRGMLSFPMPGVTLAIDLKVDARTQRVVDLVNELVIELGGRIYLTKDRFTRPEHFRAMEPRLEAFQAVRRRWDPGLHLRSAQSVRLLGDPEHGEPR